MTTRAARIGLAVVVFLSTLLAVTGWWVHDQVIDEEGWANAVGDLLDDDAVADEVAEIVTERVVASAVDGLIDIPFLPSGIEERAERTILGQAAPAVRRLMRSQAAADAWRAAARRSHGSVVAVLGDDETAFVGDRQIRLDLAPLAERLIETVTGAVSGALEFGGIEVDLTPDLDLDLTIVLYDLRDAGVGLDVADAAEQHRYLWAGIAVAAAVAVVLAGPRRDVWIAITGAVVLAASAAFIVLVRTAEPEGLAQTWHHVSATANGHTAFGASIGAVLLVVAGALRVATRR